MKRVLLILLTPALVLLLLLSVLRYWVYPRASQWALKEIENYSEKNLPARITIRNTELRLLSAALSLNDIKIEPKNEALKKYFNQLIIPQLSAHLDVFSLLIGKIQISNAIVENPQLEINADALFEGSSKPPEALPIDEIFNVIEKVPLSRFWIRNLDLKLQGKKHPVAVHLQKGQLLVSHRYPLLAIKINLPELALQIPKQPDLHFSTEMHLAWTRQSLNIVSLQTQLQDLQLQAKGQLQDLKNIAIRPKGRLQASSQFNLEKMQRLMEYLMSTSEGAKKLPQLSGSAEISTEFSIDGIKNVTGQVHVVGNQLAIENYQIGDLVLNGNLSPQKISLPEILLKHSSGQIVLKDTELYLEENFNFKSLVQSENLDLQKLFQSIELKKIPVWLNIQGSLPCEGQIKNFSLQCQGKIHGKNLEVKSDVAKGRDIIKLSEGEAEGKVQIDAEKISFDTKVKIKNSSGLVQGTVLYKDGFHVDFKSAKVDMKDIDNLVNLKFEGIGDLEGFTKGDSNNAVLELQLDNKNFVFEDHQLGDVKALLEYKMGHLYFRNLDGKMNVTTYKGDIDLNLNESRIKGNIQLPQAELIDIRKAFERAYLFPLEVQSYGQAQLKFDGPLEFWKLSYDLNADFQGGVIQGESFQNLKLHLTAQNGIMSIQNFNIAKNSSSISAKGGIGENQAINITVEAQNWRLEDSEIINKIRSNIVGSINLTSDIKGNVRNPEVLIRGNIADIYVEEQEIPSSFVNFKINSTLIEGEANLFGNKIQGDIKIPFKSGGAPLRIRMKTTDWTFTHLLSLIGAGKLQAEYESLLSSDIDLTSENGVWSEVDGKILVRKIFLKRGVFSLKNSESIEITLRKGYITLRNFLLEGPQNSIQIQGHDFKLDRMNLSINAQTELRLLHILVPFLEEVGGAARLSANLTGPFDKPQILGNANVSSVFIKLKGFPHPVEKMQSDILFSHSRILIQNLKGQLAGGNFNGEGVINIKSLNDIPTTLKAHAEGLNLEIPSKVKSNGNADLIFSGNQFPFTISGNYYVSSALAEKEFSDANSGLITVKESPYLPKILKESSFDPILLDIQVHLNRNIQVRNSQMEGFVTGLLQIKGPPQNPILLGKINTEKNTKLFFKDKTFDLQTGVINFENPNEINPDLYLSAQSRVSEYDVNLLIQGPAKNPNIHLTSIPPLPEPDIISLLALGITSSRLDQNVQSKEQATRVGYEAGAAIFSQTGIDKWSQNKLGVNVQFTSSFDSTKNISVPKITLSKNIRKKWNTSVSRAVGTDQSSNEVKIQYMINNNISAIGSWEGREASEGTSLRTGERENQSIFGLDLEFKREFK